LKFNTFAVLIIEPIVLFAKMKIYFLFSAGLLRPAFRHNGRLLLFYHIHNKKYIGSLIIYDLNEFAIFCEKLIRFVEQKIKLSL